MQTDETTDKNECLNSMMEIGVIVRCVWTYDVRNSQPKCKTVNQDLPACVSMFENEDPHLANLPELTCLNDENSAARKQTALTAVENVRQSFVRSFCKLEDIGIQQTVTPKVVDGILTERTLHNSVISKAKNCESDVCDIKQEESTETFDCSQNNTNDVVRLTVVHKAWQGIDSSDRKVRQSGKVLKRKRLREFPYHTREENISCGSNFTDTEDRICMAFEYCFSNSGKENIGQFDSVPKREHFECNTENHFEHMLKDDSAEQAELGIPSTSSKQLVESFRDAKSFNRNKMLSDVSDRLKVCLKETVAKRSKLSEVDCLHRDTTHDLVNVNVEPSYNIISCQKQRKGHSSEKYAPKSSKFTKVQNKFATCTSSVSPFRDEVSNNAIDSDTSVTTFFKQEVDYSFKAFYHKEKAAIDDPDTNIESMLVKTEDSDWTVKTPVYNGTHQTQNDIQETDSSQFIEEKQTTNTDTTSSRKEFSSDSDGLEHDLEHDYVGMEGMSDMDDEDNYHEFHNRRLVLDDQSRKFEDKWEYLYGEQGTFKHLKDRHTEWKLCLYDDSKAFRRCFEYVEWNCTMKCIHCDKEFEYFSEFVLHILGDLDCSKLNKSDVKRKKGGGKKACLPCGRKQFMKSGLIRHMLRQQTHGNNQCSFIPKEKYTDLQGSSQMSEFKPGYQCKVCDDSTVMPSLRHAIVHIKTKHTNEKLRPFTYKKLIRQKGEIIT